MVLEEEGWHGACISTEDGCGELGERVITELLRCKIPYHSISNQELKQSLIPTSLAIQS